jgi:hypothetical protein
MPIDLITPALQKRRKRLDEAFNEFCSDAPAESRLELRRLDQLSSREQVRLPFEDGQFDWVACHELIETITTHERQVRLLRELLRISRRGIFVSTPNRWHPLIRWLRPEPGLMLLDALAIKTMVDVLPGRPAWKLGHVRMAGLKSHYFLMVWKGDKQPVSEPARQDVPRDDAPPSPPVAARPVRG